MIDYLLSPLARVLAVPPVADAIIARAMCTPFFHLPGYMERWWVFNPYQDSHGQIIERSWLMRCLPSIRVQHIMRADNERHRHDHPWNARTFILRGWYMEDRKGAPLRCCLEGTTARLGYGEYHRIVEVSPGGVWTLFITWKHQGTWGFEVDGKKIPWREYPATREQDNDTKEAA